MTELSTPRGFEDGKPARVRPVYDRRVWSDHRGAAPGRTKGQLARLARQAPEVVVKVSRGIFTATKLRRHLSYVSRAGELALECPGGEQVLGAGAVNELSARWAFEAKVVNPRASIAVSVVLSMPAGTPDLGVLDAARGFARSAFADEAPYVLVLHGDRPHPHVHLTVHSVGREGRRVIPYKATVDQWREIFADQLRHRGIDAEASPRWARGVVQRRDSQALHQMRERYLAGGDRPPTVLDAALKDAEAVLFGSHSDQAEPARALAFQASVRERFAAEVRTLRDSSDQADRVLGEAAAKFMQGLPAPQTRQMMYIERLLESSRQDRDIERERSR